MRISFVSRIWYAFCDWDAESYKGPYCRYDFIGPEIEISAALSDLMICYRVALGERFGFWQ